PFFSSAWHTYTYPGVYNVTLKVYDNDGGYCVIVMQMIINNVPPTANLPASYSANEDDLITFSATISDSASDLTSLSCFWDFDAASGPLNYDAVGKTVQFTYTSAGTYTVAFVVFDRHGASNIYYTTVTISNLPPTASISTSSQIVNMESAVLFSAISSDTPSDIPKLNYIWDFNTSDTISVDAYGYEVYWIFQDNTTYSISLTVRDDNGATGVAYMTIYSANVLPIAYAGLNIDSTMDSIVTLCGYASDTPFDISTLNYTWDFADAYGLPENNFAYTINAAHVYTWPGNYLVYFNVTDQHGALASSSVWVNISNVAPIADAGNSISTMLGVQFTVDASGSTDTPSDLATLQYEWDFDGDSVPDAYTCTASWTFDTAGTYLVTLRVTDQHGAFSIDQITVYVDDGDPLIARFTVSATEAYTGDTIFVDGSSSSGTIISYDWDFGDSTTANGATASHAYSSATTLNGGYYQIRLTVTDASMRTDSYSIWVHILNRAPVAYAGADKITTMDTPVSFSDAFISDPESGPLSFEWDFGDPYDPIVETSNINPSHTYTVPGIYYATLRVTDEFGSTSISTVKVTVNNYIPSGLTINVDPNPVFEDMQVSLSASCIDTPSDSVVYFWDFDDSDGLSYETSGQNVVTSYSTPGAKTITLWAFDKYGGSAQTMNVKFVVNRPPTIINALSTVAPFSVFEDQSFSLYAVAEDNVSDFPKLNYTWEISLSGTTIYTFYTAYVNLSIPNEGNYLARITVKDDNTNFDFEEFTITVLNVQPIVEVFANTTVYVDTQVQLFATAKDNVSDLQSVVYLWDFGNDAIIDWNNPDAWGQTVSVSYYIPGNYTVSVKVIDDNGAFSIGTIWVNVLNRPPFAMVSPGCIAVEDDFAFFNALGSFDSINDTAQLTYSWDFDASDGISTDATGMYVSHVYTNIGIYIVTLTVTDPQGATDIKTTWVNVINGIPVAKAGSNQITFMDSIVFFDGSQSSDTVSDIGTLNFTWDFGDIYALPEDNIGYESTTSHSYTQPGTYTVTLTVRDIHGAINVSTLQVTVNNVQPIAHAGLDQNVLMDSIVTFDGSLSWDTVSDVSILNYTWNFGDIYCPPEENIGYDIFPTHTYTYPGNYIATLTVTDPHGASHSATVWINVSNVQPIANAGLGQFADMDSIVTFDGSLSWDTPTDILLLNYTWNFGDPNATSEENIGYGSVVSHTYTYPGNYTVILYVTDQHGAVHSSTTWVNISNIEPIASPSEGIFSYEFDNVTFSVISFYDTDSDIGTLQFYWQFNDPFANSTNPNTMSGLSAWHVFTVAGNYTVTLNVVDRHGAYNISYTFANVSNLPPSCYAGNDVIVNEEEIVIFTGLGFDTPYDQPLLNYTWDFG
ncbi:MAG: PKD domain-containing protein, partial [Thermoplasmata archaeon]